MAPPLLEGFEPANPYWLDSTAFRTHFRRSPVLRAKRHGMLRNVCVALGNWADPVAIPPLIQALHDPAPVARGHAAWALGQIWRRQDDEDARQAICDAQGNEVDAWVRSEIQQALA
jgi:epoxyqueuosine reductase